MTTAPITRRQALTAGISTMAAVTVAPAVMAPAAVARAVMARHVLNPRVLYRISLAQWSLHRAHFGGEMTALDFPRVAAETFEIHAVEYVNQFFPDRAQDREYLTTLKRVCDDHGVKSLLIMCDGEGALGHADERQRAEAVDNHKKWVAAAKFLGCHSIRVNASSSGTFEEQQQRAADGLRQLTEFAAEHDLNVLVENHGGWSSHGEWLAGVMRLVDHPRCGTLPDFGNFNIRRGEAYDRYQGTRELMPYARAVSAKSYDFDDAGNETTIDFRRMMRIVAEAGYRGYVGIEYEGSRLSEPEGIRATKRLLERVRHELTLDPAFFR